MPLLNPRVCGCAGDCEPAACAARRRGIRSAGTNCEDAGADRLPDAQNSQFETAPSPPSSLQVLWDLDKMTEDVQRLHASGLAPNGRAALLKALPAGRGSIDGAAWPSPEFRTNMLKANYGKAWADPGRKLSLDAVLVCFADQSVIEEVRAKLARERG